MVADQSILIVGAGMAGLSCATALKGQGRPVRLLDKGQGPGGRMSTRQLATPEGAATFDYGAQYFTVRDDTFRSCVDVWQAQGLVAPWPAAGDEAFVGVPSMSEPIRAMCQSHDVHWSTQARQLARVADKWHITCVGGAVHRAETLVIALPAEQAEVLLAPVSPAFAAVADSVRSMPCWTVMVAFDQPVPTPQDCWRGHPVIGWAARNSSKPGRRGPECWVLQGSPDWSAAHIEAEPDIVAGTLLDALADMIKRPIPKPISVKSHRWRYARSGASGTNALWDPSQSLGVCGDWLIGPRIEAAWLSGAALAGEITAS